MARSSQRSLSHNTIQTDTCSSKETRLESWIATFRKRRRNPSPHHPLRQPHPLSITLLCACPEHKEATNPTHQSSRPGPVSTQWPSGGKPPYLSMPALSTQLSSTKPLSNIHHSPSPYYISRPHSLTSQTPTASPTATCAGTQVPSVSSAHLTFPCLRSAS